MKWIVAPFLSFLLMMVYAGLMGKDGLQAYPIGDERLLWEEYLIIVGIVYLIIIVKKLKKSEEK
jgi:hypothetical protein